MPSNYSSARSQRARKIVAAQLPAPCIRCGGLVTDAMNWQADHIMQRSLAIAAGWTQQQIDDASNLGCSHASCNAKANRRATQSKAARVEARIPKVKRPTLETSEVFSDDAQYPGSCPTETLPDCGSEVTE